jgi:uncharacterized protein (TIGR03437 family)
MKPTPVLALLVLLLATPLAAAPKLRLSTAALGPLTIPAGQNGPLQIIEAANFGDGNLSLAVSSSVPWINPTVGATRPCNLRPFCLPVTLALNTSALPRGKYSGVVTVSDPAALDAPQTIAVAIQIGTGVPDSLDLYLPPNGFTATTFVTGASLFTTVSPPAGYTLSVVNMGGGSFSFAYSYLVTAVSPAGAAEGDYRGSFTAAGSANPEDNKNVPVTLHVTSEPIADYSPAAVRFRIAQDAGKVEKWVRFTNRGRAALSISGAASSAPWLTAAVNANTVVLTADPAGLSPGTSSATLTVNSNARNGPFTIPVTLEVAAPGPPLVFFQGVLDNALFKPGDPVAPGGIVAITGEQFTAGPPTIASGLPLGTSLGGVSVLVNDTPIPVYYVAGSHVVNPGGQINAQIPYGTPPGEAVVRVERGGQISNRVSVEIASTAPRLLVFGPETGELAGRAIAVLNEPVLTFPMPPTAGLNTRRARAGDVVTFYALGLGQTDPASIEGRPAPADPLPRVSGFRVFFGPGNLPDTGVAVEPLYLGLTPGSVGLYQVNVAVPDASPRGDAVQVALASGQTQSNRVTIAID